MDPVAVTIGLALTLGGLVCLALAVPLARGRVRPNPFYGVRFRQSFQSAEAWFAINRHGGRCLAYWSLPLIGLGALAFFLPLQSHPGLALAAGVAPLALLMVPIVQSWRFARQYRPALGGAGQP